MSKSFIKTPKIYNVLVTLLPHAATVLGLVTEWITDYDTVHPHSALRMRAPAEFPDTLNPSRTVR